MKKATLTFPSYDSLWAFINQTRAIHIRIEPRKLLLSGLFNNGEIETAITRFEAVQFPAEQTRKVPSAEISVSN